MSENITLTLILSLLLLWSCVVIIVALYDPLLLLTESEKKPAKGRLILANFSAVCLPRDRPKQCQAKLP
jgi:hypothetical protein